MIGIEAIVACIMSIDKDDPPRRAGSGGTGRQSRTLLLCYYARRLQMCIVYREKEGFNLLVLFIQKAPFCLLTDVSAHRPSISLLAWWQGGVERRRELQNIIILNGDAT